MIKRFFKIFFLYSPYFIKKKIEFLYSFIPSPNIVFWKYKRKLCKSQWYNQGEFERLQIRKLKVLIRHVYQNVPYYRRVLKNLGLKPDDITTVSDLAKLPILTKKDLRTNFEDLKARNFKKFHPILFSTSGSTENPLRFFVDADKFKITGAFNSRHLGWIGHEYWHKRVFIRYGLDDNINENKKNFQELFLWEDKVLELRITCIRDIEAEILRRLQEFSPDVIISTPSTVFFLAVYMQEGIYNLRPKAIVTTSEVLFSSQRKMIEEQFRCKVFDCYWSSEFVTMVHECPKGNLHIDSEYGIVEFLNSKGEKVEPGERGFIVATQFDNYSMPLIRYQTNDIAIPSQRICSCGRKLPLIDSLEGRAEEMIVAKNGMALGRVYPDFDSNSDIKFCQIVQKEKGHIVVKIAKNNGRSYNEQDISIEQLQKLINNELEIEIEFVPDIYPTKTGKYQFIKSEVPIEL